MFKRAVRRIRRFFASYVSPLGWAVTGAGIACLIAFPFLGWYELLVFGIVAMVMMLAAIVLSLGNTTAQRINEIARKADLCVLFQCPTH